MYSHAVPYIIGRWTEPHLGSRPCERISVVTSRCLLLTTTAFALLASSSSTNLYADAIYGTLVPGASTLPANDDGSTGLVNIGFSVNFFGATHSTLYVNNNGNFTFNSPLSTFTPFGLTGSTGIPVIAPFFADVDTRGAGSGLTNYGATSFTTNDAVNRAAFVGNWIDVGYFSTATNLLNSFQAVLIERGETGSGNFDIVFNYRQIQWETGSASGGSGGFGGSSARAGYSAGTGAVGSFFEFAGSGVNGALLDGGINSLIASSNVAINDPLYTRTAGRYVFQVREGAVINPPPTGVPEPYSLLLLTSTVVPLAIFRRRRSGV